MSSAKQKADMRAKRRASVALLYKAGYTQREIAAELNIGLGTVNKDIGLLRKHWQDQQDEIDDAFELDVQRLNEALKAIAQRVLNGDLKAIDRWLAILARRAKMFGYDAPQKTQTDLEIRAAEQIQYVDIVQPQAVSSNVDDE